MYIPNKAIFLNGRTADYIYFYHKLFHFSVYLNSHLQVLFYFSIYFFVVKNKVTVTY